MNQKKLVPLVVVGVIILVIFMILSNTVFLTIQPGERGVIFRQFGTGLDKDNIFSPGFEVVAPWNTIHIYEVKETTEDETMSVLDKNGLSIDVDITVRFHPIYSRIGYLHETFGQDYITRLVKPEVRSSVRKVMGRYSAEEIYSTKRKEVEESIILETGELLRAETNNIEMKALLIRAIKLPDNIKNAIENKLTQEQESLAYKFRLEKETSEAERKRIAAEGESTANKIINNSLTPSLLKMRGIEATLELSKSPNSKTIIIGSGKDGMPLILGGSN